jgi:hypothetical protein
MANKAMQQAEQAQQAQQTVPKAPVRQPLYMLAYSDMVDLAKIHTYTEA